MGRITAAGVAWSVGRHPLLRGVDLDAHDGEVVGLLGPNGSGKTTLLRLLAGLRRPDTGTIRYDADDLTGLTRRQVARRLAVVEQDTTATDTLTVRQVVDLGRTPFRGRFDALTGEDRRIVDDALARVDLTDRQHQGWHTLSGGERQRTQLARALAQQPREILLDEPTNHLDIRHQLELLDLLRTLEATCVIALHDLNLAARYCDHLVLLDAGRVAATGEPREVLTPGILRTVYGVEALVDDEPVSGALRVTFLGPAGRPAPRPPRSTPGPGDPEPRHRHGDAGRSPGRTMPGSALDGQQPGQVGPDVPGGSPRTPGGGRPTGRRP